MNDAVGPLHRIGARDIVRLMKGEWYILYREKMGIQKKKPFAESIHSQLGLVTEPFHAQLVTNALNVQVPGNAIWKLVEPDLISHPSGHNIDHVCMLDRRCYITNENKVTTKYYPVELKFPHHSRWFEDRLEAYYPQIQWQIYVTNSSKAIFSCLWLEHHQWQWIERNQEYIDMLLQIAHDFSWHLIHKTPPKRNMTL